MRTRHLLALLATLLITTAQAGLLSDTAPDVTLRLSGFALGYGAVDTSKTGWVGAGEFTGQITRDGVTSSFLTYCTDIYQSFNWNTTYIYRPFVVSCGKRHSQWAVVVGACGHVDKSLQRLVHT